MKMTYRVLLALAAFFLIFVIAGFFALPVILQSAGGQKLTEILHRETTIERVSVNPLRLSVTISGVRIADPGQDAPFAAFDELYVNIDALSSIFRRALILEEIRLVRPAITLTRRTDGIYNLSDLIPGETPPETEATEPFHFSLNNIRIEDGRIVFHDMLNRTDHTVDSLNLSIPFLSNIAYYVKQYVEPAFSASVNGHAVQATGQTRPFADSRETTLTIKFKEVDLAHYLEYAPVKMNFTLLSARLDATLNIHFIIHHNDTPALAITGSVALADIALDDPQNSKLLRLDKLQVDIAKIEPLAQAIHLSRVALVKPDIVVRRERKGQINLTNLIAPVRSDTAQKPESTPAQKPGPSFDLRIDAIRVTQGSVAFIDLHPARPVNLLLAPLDLQIDHLSTKKESPATLDLALAINRQGRLSATGKFTLDPLSAQLEADLKQLAIRPFEPYFTDYMKIDITGGTVSTKATISLSADSTASPAILVSADASVNNFAAIDRVKSNDFLKFRRLAFSAMTAGNVPAFLKISKITLEDFFARIAINEDGSTNIQSIFDGNTQNEAKIASETGTEAETGTDHPSPDAKIAEPDADIRIGQVRFSGGTVEFSDRHIQPNYSATLLNLAGSVTGLSSQDFSRANVDLKANLGLGSPVEIAGTINPLAKNLFVDIQVAFKDIEMSPFSPYTGKYLGYPITKGKLNLGVRYLIDQQNLRAENKVYFDQLAFGEPTGSPEAISAPVTLAVSLLTDRNGKINLDLPISGSLDDPEFRILPILWQILLNLITKAATSPFSVLSSLAGAGEELSYIEFEPGQAGLPAKGQKKIDTLAKALYDRPALKLEIGAFIDLKADAEALKESEFIRLLKTQKLKEMINKGVDPAPVDDVSIASDEYVKYLTAAYKDAKFTKPRTALGFLKTLPPAEMEALLKNHISITENSLNNLAAARAQTARDRLLQSADIEPARIFLTKPQSLTPPEKDNVADSRVEFKVK